MQPYACDRTEHCLNFRHAPKTFCSSCGTLIMTNHFHNLSEHYRLCAACFFNHLNEIASGNYRPCGDTHSEQPLCLNQEVCFHPHRYSLYVETLCDICGTYPIAHFHDISQNIRLCLGCFLKRSHLYVTKQESPTKDNS